MYKSRLCDLYKGNLSCGYAVPAFQLSPKPPNFKPAVLFVLTYMKFSGGIKLPVYLWLLFGTFSFAFVVIGLIRTVLKKYPYRHLFLFLSLISGALSLLAALAQTYVYVFRGDWAAIEDVFPALFAISATSAVIGIILNTVILLLNKKHE